MPTISQIKYWESLKGHPQWNTGRTRFKKGNSNGLKTQFKKGHLGFWLGKKHSGVTSIKNFFWKGNKASYGAKHKWISYHFGKPDTCEDCNRKGLVGRAIHWANISKRYLRKRNDWLRLCAKCHYQYDHGD